MNQGINVRLRAESGEFRAEFERSRMQLQGFRNDIGAVTTRLAQMGGGVVGIGAGIRLLNSQLDRFDSLGTLARNLEEPVESLQRLEFVAEQSRTTLDAVTGATEELNNRLRDVDSNPAVVQALENLRLNGAALSGLGLEEQISAISDAYVNARNPTEAYADVLALVGSGVDGLLPLLRLGSEGISDLTNDLEILSGADVQVVQDFNSALTDIRTNFEARFAEGFIENLDEIQVLAERVGDVLLNTTSFISEHQGAIRGLVLAYAGFRIGNFVQSQAGIVTALGNTVAQLVISTFTLGRETEALGRNSTAQALNAQVRGRLAAEFSGAGLRRTVATGTANLGPIIGVAIAGWQLGGFIDDQFEISESVLNRIFRSIDQVREANNTLLVQSRESVLNAEDEVALRREQASITASISDLRERARGASGDERADIEATTRAMEQLLANSDRLNESFRNRESPSGEVEDLDQVNRNLEFRNRIEAEGAEIRERRLVALNAEVTALREQGAVDLFDAQSESDKLAQLERERDSRLSNLQTSLQIVGIDRQFDPNELDFNDLIQTADLLAETNPETARTVLQAAQEVREQSEQIAELNEGINARYEERASLLRGLQVLEARANGDEDTVRLLEDQNRLIQLQAQFAETLGVSREEALRVAERQLSLESQIANNAMNSITAQEELARIQAAFRADADAVANMPTVADDGVAESQRNLLSLVEREAEIRAGILAPQVENMNVLLTQGRELNRILSEGVGVSALRSVNEIVIRDDRSESATASTDTSTAITEFLAQAQVADEVKVSLLAQVASNTNATTAGLEPVEGNGLI